MSYDAIIIRPYDPKKHKNPTKGLLYRVEYTFSNEPDTTGLGGTWGGSGSLLDVYEVGKFLVGQRVGNWRPVIVATSTKALKNALWEYTNCSNIKMI